MNPTDSERTPTDQQEATQNESELAVMNIQIPFPTSYTYVNCAAFGIGPTEIRIGFAEALPSGHAESRIGVVMAPEAAATLALMLFTQLAVFEKNFGPI